MTPAPIKATTAQQLPAELRRRPQRRRRRQRRPVQRRPSRPPLSPARIFHRLRQSAAGSSATATVTAQTCARTTLPHLAGQITLARTRPARRLRPTQADRPPANRTAKPRRPGCRGGKAGCRRQCRRQHAGIRRIANQPATGSGVLLSDAGRSRPQRRLLISLPRMQQTPAATGASSSAQTATNTAEGRHRQFADFRHPCDKFGDGPDRDGGASSTPAAAVSIAGLPIAIAARALAGSNQFDIRLDPPELGRIDVRLDVDSNGQVTSHVTVDRPETLTLLQSQQPQLERALEQAGLKTADNGLQFSLRDQSFAGTEQWRRRAAKPGAAACHSRRRFVAGGDDANLLPPQSRRQRHRHSRVNRQIGLKDRP